MIMDQILDGDRLDLLRKNADRGCIFSSRDVLMLCDTADHWRAMANDMAVQQSTLSFALEREQAECRRLKQAAIDRAPHREAMEKEVKALRGMLATEQVSYLKQQRQLDSTLEQLDTERAQHAVTRGRLKQANEQHRRAVEAHELTAQRLLQVTEREAFPPVTMKVLTPAREQELLAQINKLSKETLGRAEDQARLRSEIKRLEDSVNYLTRITQQRDPPMTATELMRGYENDVMMREAEARSQMARLLYPRASHLAADQVQRETTDAILQLKRDVFRLLNARDDQGHVNDETRAQATALRVKLEALEAKVNAAVCRSEGADKNGG